MYAESPVFRIKALSLFAAALVLGACSSPPVAAPTPPARSAPVVVSAPTPAPAATPRPAPSSSVATVALPEYLDPKSSLSSGRVVYFDFDGFGVNKEFAPLVERHGKYLGAHPAVAIRIEGSADERGGAEYNLALGQKRAEAVLRSLKIYGAKESQMEAVSWGESKPVAKEHDESAWAQNRRAELRYPAR